MGDPFTRFDSGTEYGHFGVLRFGACSAAALDLFTLGKLNPIMKPHRGTLILVLGILSLVICAPLGIFAWIMGGDDLKQMDAGAMDPNGRPLTSAGRICGIIGTALLALVVLSVIVLMALGIGGWSLGHH